MSYLLHLFLVCFGSGLFKPVRPACFCAGLFAVSLGWFRIVFPVCSLGTFVFRLLFLALIVDTAIKLGFPHFPLLSALDSAPTTPGCVTGPYSN